MGSAETIIDPFCAPEFFCDDATFEMAAPGVVRVFMTLHEHGEVIAKVRLLLPLSSLPGCIASATAFTISRAAAGLIGDGGTEPMRLM
jgi:hypothetical protein